MLRIVMQLLLLFWHEPVSSSVPAGPVDFKRDIQPLLQRRCQPCHFPGGKMYAKLPFDRAETIEKLGTRLFTRIRKEDEQELIRRYLAQRR
jgi:hypothetical protein